MEVQIPNILKWSFRQILPTLWQTKAHIYTLLAIQQVGFKLQKSTLEIIFYYTETRHIHILRWPPSSLSAFLLQKTGFFNNIFRRTGQIKKKKKGFKIQNSQVIFRKDLTSKINKVLTKNIVVCPSRTVNQLTLCYFNKLNCKSAEY